MGRVELWCHLLLSGWVDAGEVLKAGQAPHWGRWSRLGRKQWELVFLLTLWPRVLCSFRGTSLSFQE